MHMFHQIMFTFAFCIKPSIYIRFKGSYETFNCWGMSACLNMFNIISINKSKIQCSKTTFFIAV